MQTNYNAMDSTPTTPKNNNNLTNGTRFRCKKDKNTQSIACGVRLEHRQIIRPDSAAEPPVPPLLRGSYGSGCNGRATTVRDHFETTVHASGCRIATSPPSLPKSVYRRVKRAINGGARKKKSGRIILITRDRYLLSDAPWRYRGKKKGDES